MAIDEQVRAAVGGWQNIIRSTWDSPKWTRPAPSSSARPALAQYTDNGSRLLATKDMSPLQELGVTGLDAIDGRPWSNPVRTAPR